MKAIINFSLNNKFAVWLLTIMLVAAGLYSGLNMKQETIPDLNVPVLTVSTVYPGAAPEEVANNVTIPLEQRIKSLSGIDVLNSTSMENVSSIIIQYNFDKNMDKAVEEVRQAISGFQLPKGAQESMVNRISLNDFPVISLSVSGTGKSLEEITGIVENEIKPALEGIDGAGTVNISGQHMKEVQLTYNQEKMKALGLSESTVQAIVQGSAVKAPLGIFAIDGSEKTIVVDGKVTTLDDLKNLAIPAIPSGAAQQGAMSPGAGQMAAAQGAALQGAAAQGAVPSGAGQQDAAALGGAAQQTAAGIPTVKLQDIADVKLVDIADSVSRTNGNESIGINISKAPDANTVDVVNAVKKEAEKIEKEHPGVKMLTMLDQGKPIEDSVSTMLNKAMFGALFAIIIIMLFLRNIRTTIISIISIPLSLLIAVLIMHQMGYSLNIMTLGAMTVAIGRVVDDSIVVIENNYRRMSMKSEKLRGKALVRVATAEMFMPILSSTLVTIAVFLPLGMVSGMVGELFLPFALTMVFSLLASLVVAITIVPMLTHIMFRKGLKNKTAHDDKPGTLGTAYRNVLNWALNHKIITFGTATVLLAASMLLVSVVGVSFMPEEEQKYAMITYSPAPGQLLSDVEKTAQQAEKTIMERQGFDSLQYSVGGQNMNPMNMGGGGSKSALFYIQYKNDTKDFAKEKENLLNDLSSLDSKGTWGTMDMTGGLGGNKLSLTVYGDSLEEIQPIAEKVQKLMEEDKNFEKVETSLSKTYEQYTLVADQQKLSQLGLTTGQIAMKLMPVRERSVLTEVKADGKQYKVYVNADKEQFKTIQDIENSTIASPLGIQVPLKDVVKVEKGISPNSITRQDGRLYVEVSADVTAKNVNKASNDLKANVEKIEKPTTVSVDFGGVSKQINDTFKQLGLAMAAAVAIVYFLMVLTFGGALTPFAILFSLPFAIIGALVALYLAGETISATAMMGALMLIGIVITNAIVLLDRVIHKEKEGLSTREALLEAAGTRLRPILMTALATVGALLPLALGFEETSGSLISKGLGVTVIGGLLSSTLLTLLIVPIVYEFLAKFRRKSLADE